MSLLLQFCASNDNLPSTSSGVHQTEMKIWGEVFEWLSILWVQGLRHGNPQGIIGQLTQLFSQTSLFSFIKMPIQL